MTNDLYAQLKEDLGDLYNTELVATWHEGADHTPLEAMVSAQLRNIMKSIIVDANWNYVYGSVSVTLFQPVMLSFYDEADIPDSWRRPRTTPVSRGGNQVCREALDGAERGVEWLVLTKPDHPFTKNYLAHRDEFDSPYATVKLARVLATYPYTE